MMHLVGVSAGIDAVLLLLVTLGLEGLGLGTTSLGLLSELLLNKGLTLLLVCALLLSFSVLAFLARKVPLIRTFLPNRAAFMHREALDLSAEGIFGGPIDGKGRAKEKERPATTVEKLGTSLETAGSPKAKGKEAKARGFVPTQ